MDIVKLLAGAISSIQDARAAGDAQAEAAALVDLDTAIAESHPEVVELKNKIAANRAEALSNLAEKFPEGSNTGDRAARADEITKP